MFYSPIQVQQLCSTKEEFRNDKGIRRGLQNWGRFTKLSNMHTERLLSLIKNGSGKSPTIERLTAAGLLTQVLKEHTKAGGDDPRRSAKKKDLVAAGVPLQGSQARESKKSPGRARGCLRTSGSTSHQAWTSTRGARRVPDWPTCSTVCQKKNSWIMLSMSVDGLQQDHVLPAAVRYDVNIGGKLWGLFIALGPVQA